jgi:hypothetical protein
MDASELRQQLGEHKRANARAERELSPTDQSDRLDALEQRGSSPTSGSHSDADRSGARSNTPNGSNATNGDGAPAAGDGGSPSNGDNAAGGARGTGGDNPDGGAGRDSASSSVNAGRGDGTANGNGPGGSPDGASPSANKYGASSGPGGDDDGARGRNGADSSGNAGRGDGTANGNGPGGSPDGASPSANKYGASSGPGGDGDGARGRNGADSSGNAGSGDGTPNGNGPGGSPDGASPSANKYGASSGPGSGEGGGSPRRGEVGVQGDTYIPPSRGDGSSNVALTATNDRGKRWGVRMGTWAAAQLTRSVSSADSSAIELELVEPLSGEQRNVPAGTTLFADGSFNKGTRRLTLEVEKGITPNGREFKISATVYDRSKRAGLSGTVVRQRDDEVKAAAGDGALTLAESVIGGVTGSGAAGQAAGETAKSLLEKEKQTQKEAPQAVIRTNPQRALIRVDESF